ncbi:MAG: GspH/FimT family pseudopilin [Methylophilaceae bacterium]
MLVSAKKIQFGFSLIELMIAVSLLGILTALAMPSYRNWIQNTMIRNAAESIQNGLQKARMEAVKHNANVQFVLGANSAWSVGCVTVTADCPDPIEQRAAKEGSSTNISATATPAGATTIIFTNLGTVSPSPPAATVPFTQLDIDNSTLSAADSRNLRITLSTNGSVRMCDPDSSLSADDPRKC